MLCVAFDEALEAYSEAHTGDSQDIGKGGENRGPVSGMSLFPQVQQSGSDWVGLSKEQRGRGEFAAGLKAHRGGKYGLVGGAGGAERHAVMTRQCDFGDAQQPGRGDDGMAHAGPLQREASPETPTDRAMWMARHHCWHPALDWMGKWEGGAEGCMLGRKGEGGGDRRWYDECEAGDRRTGADGGQGGRREQKSPCEKRGAPPGRGWWCGGSARQPREEGFPACVRIGGVRGTRARNWVIGVGVDPGSEAGAEEQWPRRDVWTDGTAWGDVGGVSARPFDGLDVGGSLRGEAMGDGGVGEEEWDMLESVARDMAEVRGGVCLLGPAARRWMRAPHDYGTRDLGMMQECLGEGRVEVLQEAMLAFFIAGLQARRQ